MFNFQFQTMEKLTEKSELTIPNSAVIHNIPETIVGVRERILQKIATTTSVDSTKDDVQFSINPNIPYEVRYFGGMCVCVCVYVCVCVRACVCVCV